MPCKSSFSTNTSIDIHEDETGETPNLDAKSGCGHAMAQNSQTVLAQESSWLLCGNFTLQGTYGSVLLVGDGRYVVAREHVVAYIQDHFPLQLTPEKELWEPPKCLPNFQGPEVS